jgi:hypothetical protein
MAEHARPRPLPDSHKMRTLRRRAYEELALAIDLSNGDLPANWLSQGDRDLQSLRERDDPEWRFLLMRLSGDEVSGEFPQPSWGDPHRRLERWGTFGAVLLLAAVAVFVLFAPIWFVGAVAFVLLVGALCVAYELGVRTALKAIGAGLVALVAAALLLLVAPPWSIVALVLGLAGIASAVVAVDAALEGRRRDASAISAASKQQERPGETRSDADPGGPTLLG